MKLVRCKQKKITKALMRDQHTLLSSICSYFTEKILSVGGLLYLGGLRFLQFLTAVFWFFTNIGAIFRFCRLLRFAEMDVFLTRFSALSYYHCGFSVFEKHAVFGYFPPYRGSRFANTLAHITACSLRQ